MNSLAASDLPKIELKAFIQSNLVKRSTFAFVRDPVNYILQIILAASFVSFSSAFRHFAVQGRSHRPESAEINKTALR